MPILHVLGTYQDDTSVVPASRLANIYAQSKEFTTTKQQLNEKLEVALGQPLGKTPKFATNLFWQVNFVCV